jgi:hypothetical protein
MSSYAKQRPNKEKEEDEELFRKRIFEENVLAQKAVLRKEFDQIQEEKKFDKITVFSNNEMNFKNILNNTSAETERKKNILEKLQDTLEDMIAQRTEVPHKRLSCF